jgi:hypothetical protein
MGQLDITHSETDALYSIHHWRMLRFIRPVRSISVALYPSRLDMRLVVRYLIRLYVCAGIELQPITRPAALRS